MSGAVGTIGLDRLAAQPPFQIDADGAVVQRIRQGADQGNGACRVGVDDLIKALRAAVASGQDTRPVLQHFRERFSDEEYTAITKEFARLWHAP